MFSRHKFLFPVDFSDQCKLSIPYVTDVTRRLRARLHFLHSVDERFGREGMDLEEVCLEQAKELAAFAAQLPGGQYCPQAVTYGSPATAIVNYAKRQDIEAIIMPTKGQGALRRMFVGSVTLEVLRKTHCAVWTQTGIGEPHVRWSPVLCAIDLEFGSEEVLTYASCLADTFHAKLIVIHAVPPMSDGALWHASDLPAALSDSVAEQKLRTLLQTADILAEPVIRTGGVVEVVREAAERTGAQLLVIGRGGRARTTASLGGNTFNLIRNSPCAVVSCPERREADASFWTEWQQPEQVEREWSEHLAARTIR